MEKEIWPPAEALYIQGMLYCTSSAFESMDAIESEFGENPEEKILEGPPELNWALVLRHLQNVVLQAGSLSKYFWPIRKQHYWRGRILRDKFGLSDGHALQSRKLRDAFEHFDERLDAYIESGLVGIVLPQFVGPRPRSDGVPGHFFWAYLVDENSFQLLGENFALEPIVAGILEIHEKLQVFESNGSRMVHPEEIEV